MAARNGRMPTAPLRCCAGRRSPSESETHSVRGMVERSPQRRMVRRSRQRHVVGHSAQFAPLLGGAAFLKVPLPGLFTLFEETLDRREVHTRSDVQGDHVHRARHPLTCDAHGIKGIQDRLAMAP